jgi:flagellar motor switch protein FliN/FliY
MSTKAAVPVPAPAFDLSLLKDIRVRIAIEIGRTELSVGDILELRPGSVFGLDRAAGEPGDICVNGHYVARGDILAMKEGSGVKITEFLQPRAEAEAQQ